MKISRLFVSILFVLVSLAPAFPLTFTSIPTTEIAEGQYYFYKIMLDKTIPIGRVEVIEKPDWLKLEAAILSIR